MMAKIITYAILSFIFLTIGWIYQIMDFGILSLIFTSLALGNFIEEITKNTGSMNKGGK